MPSVGIAIWAGGVDEDSCRKSGRRWAVFASLGIFVIGLVGSELGIGDHVVFVGVESDVIRFTPEITENPFLTILPDAVFAFSGGGKVDKLDLFEVEYGFFERR